MIHFTIKIEGLVTTINRIMPDSVPHGSGSSIAGIDMIDAVTNYLKEKYRLLIGRVTCMAVIHQLGSHQEEATMEIQGRNLVTGRPNAREIRRSEVQEAVSGVIDQLVRDISSSINFGLRDLEPDDLVDVQITLKGEFANVFELDKRLSEAVGHLVIFEE
jgi:rod shape-determining protein MreB